MDVPLFYPTSGQNYLIASEIQACSNGMTLLPREDLKLPEAQYKTESDSRTLFVYFNLW